MANIISFDKCKNVDDLKMPNGGTDAFLNVMLISGCHLAEKESQKRLLVWLAEKDQIVSRGCSGFDIEEMPWEIQHFDDDKEFLLSVIKAAKERKNWELLDYTPNYEIVVGYLEKFEAIVSAFSLQYINETALHNWLSKKDNSDPVLCGYPKCKKHRVYLSFFGCQVCNG